MSQPSGRGSRNTGARLSRLNSPSSGWSTASNRSSSAASIRPGRREPTMRLLFLSAWYPYPATNGSKLRIYNLLRGLADQHRVTLLTFADEPNDDVPPELASICERVVAFPRRTYRP